MVAKFLQLEFEQLVAKCSLDLWTSGLWDVHNYTVQLCFYHKLDRLFKVDASVVQTWIFVLLGKKTLNILCLKQSWANCSPWVCRFFLNGLPYFMRKITFIKILFVLFYSHIHLKIYVYLEKLVSKGNNYYMFDLSFLPNNTFWIFHIVKWINLKSILLIFCTFFNVFFYQHYFSI